MTCDIQAGQAGPPGCQGPCETQLFQPGLNASLSDTGGLNGSKAAGSAALWKCLQLRHVIAVMLGAQLFCRSVNFDMMICDGSQLCRVWLHRSSLLQPEACSSRSDIKKTEKENVICSFILPVAVNVTRVGVSVCSCRNSCCVVPFHFSLT